MNALRHLALVLLVLAVACGDDDDSAEPTPTPAGPLRILVTNDDGVEGEGISLPAIHPGL